MTKLFIGGVPTAPEVNALISALGIPADGVEVTHEQVEEITHAKHGTHRYVAITQAWRGKLLRESNVLMAAVRGIGFRALPPDERVNSDITRFQSGTRKQGRAIRDLAAVNDDALDVTHRARKDHALKYGAAILAQATALQRQLQPPKAQQQLPQKVQP